jgi:hypothetical protein
VNDPEIQQSKRPPLMQLTEELTGISLLDSGTVNPFFMLAVGKDALQIPVDFSNNEQLEFTTVKIAAILQLKKCDHYCFATRIQFKASAGGKEVMKQQVLILFATKAEISRENSNGYDCSAQLYDLKLNQELGRPQLKEQQALEDYDGQFSNLFSAPKVPDDLMKQLTANVEQYNYSVKGKSVKGKPTT